MRGRTSRRRCSLADGGRRSLQAAHQAKGRRLPEQVESKKSQALGNRVTRFLR